MKPGTIKNPWPVAITAVFTFFFAALVTFIIFAAHQNVDLVRVDYYEAEIRYQQQVDRVRRTQQMNEPVDIAYNFNRQRIIIRLPTTHVGHSTGLVHLYRPSDARLDQRLPLALDASGTQILDATRLRGGLWRVRVQWTVAGREYFLDRSVVLRSPLPS